MNRYAFTEIPNNEEGRELVRLMRKYLNRDTYAMRVKGQYLKEELKGGYEWHKNTHGQPVQDSKCLRVYLDSKLVKAQADSTYLLRAEAREAREQHNRLLNDLFKLLDNHE
ncbi:hypothetical protein N8908_01565 [bacterium]|nr:hypothetical protein [bacterium]